MTLILLVSAHVTKQQKVGNARLQSMSIAYYMNMYNGSASLAIFLFLFEDVHTLFLATISIYSIKTFLGDTFMYFSSSHRIHIS